MQISEEIGRCGHQIFNRPKIHAEENDFYMPFVFKIQLSIPCTSERKHILQYDVFLDESSFASKPDREITDCEIILILPFHETG